MNKVTILKNGEPYRELPLEARMMIGRRAGHAIQIEDHRLSRDHAEINRQDDGYFLRDKGSTNGTFLNGAKIASDSGVRLKNGDVIQLGAFELRFTITEAPPPAPAREVARPAVYDGPPPTSPLMEHLIAGRDRIPVWASGDLTVKVADIIDEAQDVRTYRFTGKQPLMFSYKPGQFVTLILNIDGKEVKRSYSMSSSPSRPHTIELTVKRVPGGLVSNWLADNLKLGDEVRIRGPAGKFSCFEYPSRKLLFMAAGSGITPLMSMTRWIVDTTADTDVRFLLSARTPSDIIFAREIEFIAARHTAFQCMITLTGGCTNESWTGCRGRVCRPILELLAPDLAERHIFMCGPEPFAAAVKELLRDVGFPMAQLHTESFGGKRVATGTNVEPRDAAPKTMFFAAPPGSSPSIARAAAPAAPAAAAAAAPALHEVFFAKSGKRVTTNGEASILDLAEANGVEINYACRTGSCGECRVLCKEGRVEMEDDAGLPPGDKERGYVLTCVGTPRSNVVLEA